MGNISDINEAKGVNLITTVLVAVLIALMGGLSTWLFKLDDRQFQLRSTVVTREELQKTVGDLDNRIDKRFDNVESMLRKLIDQQSSRHNNN